MLCGQTLHTPDVSENRWLYYKESKSINFQHQSFSAERSTSPQGSSCTPPWAQESGPRPHRGMGVKSGSSGGEPCGVIERPQTGAPLLGGPVGNLAALQDRPSVSLHVVEQRNEDGRAHQELWSTQRHSWCHSTPSNAWWEGSAPIWGAVRLKHEAVWKWGRRLQASCWPLTSWRDLDFKGFSSL